jgi:hypothetical protein
MESLMPEINSNPPVQTLLTQNPLTQNPLAQNLRETNTRLGFWLDRMINHETRERRAPRNLIPQQMAALLSELMRAGQWLRELPRDREPEIEQELNRYCKNVERVRDLLPSMQAALLEERARLEQERARVRSAVEWARRSRQTL